ncbi:MAG: TetR/AcrR family transcriptional regulator, partial [Lachnospiraceae bacterium]|nr:TetR/AcrR family transcriptional regulator [Lachnospiraceae bacterium]
MPIRVFDEEEKQNIKAKMIEAGLTLIKKYGLTHTSVVKITQAAGIGKSTFYNFFPSKEVFVIELIQYERSKLMNYFDQLLNGREKMTKQEAKTFLKKIIFHQDSIYQYLTEEDM